jgi:predicted transglutaminase-like cysteine proteinase
VQRLIAWAIAGAVGLVVSLPVQAQPVVLDAARWAELEAVRAEIAALPRRSDRDRFGRADIWQIADGTGGDCEDLALAARARLHSLGWPADALRLALAWDETGTYHAVLTVETVHRGLPATYVIDNRIPWVVGWSALTRYGYRWNIRQSGRLGEWVRIAGDQADAR